MRLVALLVPVALVGGLLAIRSNHDHNDRIHVVPDAPVPTVVAVREAPRVEVRAPRLRYSTRVQETESATVTIDLEGTIAATIEAALQAATAGLENVDVSTEMSFEVTESVLEAIGKLLGEVAVSIEGELELVTKQGAHIRIAGDGNAQVTVIDISN
jgi:hypothetical protein